MNVCVCPPTPAFAFLKTNRCNLYMSAIFAMSVRVVSVHLLYVQPCACVRVSPRVSLILKKKKKKEDHLIGAITDAECKNKKKKERHNSPK